VFKDSGQVFGALGKIATVLAGDQACATACATAAELLGGGQWTEPALWALGLGLALRFKERRRKT
jgi:hypothetical protein